MSMTTPVYLFVLLAIVLVYGDHSEIEDFCELSEHIMAYRGSRRARNMVSRARSRQGFRRYKRVRGRVKAWRFKSMIKQLNARIRRTRNYRARRNLMALRAKILSYIRY